MGEPGPSPSPSPSPAPAPTRTAAPRAWPTAAPRPLHPASQKIFVSVAAYCDPLLGFTLRNAMAQADRPERLRFGVVEQCWPEQQLHLSADWAQQQLRWLRVHALEARGPCWARSLAMGLYEGEPWCLQIDSHTWFEPGWDTRLIDWSAVCAAHNPRHLISCYPNPFELRQGEPYAHQVGPKVLEHVVKADSSFAPDHPVLMFEGVPVASDTPIPALHVGAGCLWGPGHWVEALPYDPYLYFHGEEQSLALRAWTRGWDLFHVPAMPLYHLYNTPGATNRAVHWDPSHDEQRRRRAWQQTAAAHRRLRAMLWEDADLGAYGLGHARSLEAYAEWSGIDYRARTIAPRARRPRGSAEPAPAG